MQSFSAQNPANPRSHSGQIHPALTSFADEVCATIARLFVYVGCLALIGILGLQAWQQLSVDLAAEPAPEAGWSVADRSYPAFAESRPLEASDKSQNSDAYLILRHPLGGRKDILRWSGAGGKVNAELEIYHPGSEYGSVTEARAELARRMQAPGAELEPAGVIESKFGAFSLLRQAGNKAGAPSCLGFLKRIDDPALQISGWSCQGDTLPARRAAIGCMLSRLMLLTAGNDPKLAELFANAELKRGSCAPSTATADWITGSENPRLRGPL